jgi:hypothetical protein
MFDVLCKNEENRKEWDGFFQGMKDKVRYKNRIVKAII